MNFESAEQKCTSHGGHLASILSNEEAGFIQSYIGELNESFDRKRALMKYHR